VVQAVVLVQAEETAVVEAQAAVLGVQAAVVAVQAAVVAVQAAVVAVQAAAPWVAGEEVAEAPGGGSAGVARGSCGRR